MVYIIEATPSERHPRGRTHVYNDENGHVQDLVAMDVGFPSRSPDEIHIDRDGVVRKMTWRICNG